MVKFERNEACFCGSSKKYKKCHGSPTPELWSEVISEVNFEHPMSSIIKQTYVTLNDTFIQNPNPGACHLISSILYILLSEQKVESSLCIGEVEGPKGFYFDHSWIEVDGKIFDLAVQFTLDGQRFAPVYASHDLISGKPTVFNYRFKKDGLDNIASKVMRTPFVQYLDGALEEYGWGQVEEVAQQLGLKLDRNQLRTTYKDVQREFVSS